MHPHSDDTQSPKRETKRKQLAQLAGRQNIKLELKMGNYANWFITWQLPKGRREGENNKNSEEGGKTDKHKFKMPNCTNFNGYEKSYDKLHSNRKRRYSRAQAVATLSRLDLLRYIPRANAPWSDVAS